MLLGAFLIGLREGLEAALIIGILVAYLRREGRGELVTRIWSGAGIAVVVSVALGAVFTFGRYGLSFTAQEVIGGVMSLVAVAMITWMAFWMMRSGHRIKSDLEQGASRGLASGNGWVLFWLALVSVGREGIETTLLLWGWAMQPLALVGALAGIGVSVALGYIVFRGLVRVNLGTFFTWTGALLIVVAAGILAYGVHDLQEAAVLPGPWSGHPITPTDLRTGEVLVGLTDGPFWMAAFPFGWAFDLTGTIDPNGVIASLAKGTLGLTPLMTWVEVLAWATYLLWVLPKFLRLSRRNRRAAAERAAQRAAQPAAPSDPPVPADQPETASVRAPAPVGAAIR